MQALTPKSLQSKHVINYFNLCRNKMSQNLSGNQMISGKNYDVKIWKKRLKNCNY